MRKISVIALLLWFVLNVTGQTPLGSWSDHLSYNSAKSIAVGTQDVYASTGSSIIVYNKKFTELKKMSTINGLTETGISTIFWSELYETLIIGYTSTNVDLIIKNTIFNIPDIYRKYIPGKKQINRIRTNGKYAYLACSFGIVVVDIIKKEVSDTWKPGNGSETTEVLDITFGNDKIYAATGTGVYSASLWNPGLSYFGNWSLVNVLPDPTGRYTSLIFSGDKLFVNKADPISDGDSVFVTNETTALLSYFSGVHNLSFDPAPGGFTISALTSVRYYNNDGSLKTIISSYGWGSPNISQAIADNGDIWIADSISGLIKGENMSYFTALNLPGPISNNAFYISSLNGKTIICSGATDASWNNLQRPLQISIHRNNIWTSITHSTINDAIRALIDPDDENHLFVSTWGGGLLEYKDNLLVKQHTEINSPLQSIIPGKPFVRLCGLAMDNDKNLWITQTGVQGSIKVLKADGHWIANPVTIDAPIIGDLIITGNGHKWIVLPGGYGLFVFDDNNTPTAFGDDRYKRILVEDTEKQLISAVYCIAEDLDGNIWLGTDQGPLIYYNPGRVFDENLKAGRIKIPRDDGTGLSDYMLKSETITSIAVDGANRIWLGTLSSGAYYFSSNETKLIKNFNEQNSPILSNSIVSLAIDNKSGDIWFGSSKGIQSFRGNATTGEENFTNVYTFPNPVREDFTGNVTITGLMSNSQISITDISGNLVYKTLSDGGQATWDLKTYNGKRVATGVYLVFCASNDGSRSFVTKILIIR